MKTFIISDIHGKSESIIPYGLNLAKTFEAEVDILHTIDSRVFQGEYSSFSDSQSITPGHTFSQEEVIEREKNWAKIELDKLLSSEASRLNYPLNINTIVEENSIMEAAQTKHQNEPTAIFVISIEPDGYIFETKEEIRETIKNTGIICILVSPGIEFRGFKKVLLPTDFDSKKISAFTVVKSFLEHFKPIVNAVSVTTQNDFTELELKGKAWKEVAGKYFLPSTLKTNVIEGEKFMDTLLTYLKRNNFDLVLLVLQKPNAIKSLFTKNELSTLPEHTNMPVLLYYHSG